MQSEKLTPEQRVNRWLDWAELNSFKLTRILVHPEDLYKLPRTIRNLPVVTFNNIGRIV